jgi:predicted RNA polymerase sigma factor
MKYVLRFVETEPFEEDWEAMGPAVRERADRLDPSRGLRADLGADRPPRARADLLRALGRSAEARAADRRALALTANPAEQALLRRWIDWGDDAG